jgi:hypothetical protein
MNTVVVHPGRAVRYLRRKGYRVLGTVFMRGQRPLVVMGRV